MKVGIVFGAFDLLHAGHIYLLKEARKRCDELIVAIHVDPNIERPEKNKPIESLFERIIKLRGQKEVGKLIAYEKESDIKAIIHFYNVDVRFLGSDYGDGKKEISYPDLVPIIYIDSLPIHSSDIRKRL